MLSRRHLRIKVMQAIFAFSRSGIESAAAEKNLIGSLNSIYDLYIHQLSFISFLSELALKRTEENKSKRLPTAEDLEPNMRFVDNPLMLTLRHSDELQKEINRSKPNWHNEDELGRRILSEFRKSDDYTIYMEAEKVGMKEHKEIVFLLFEEFVFGNEHFNSYLEEKNLSWSSDKTQAGQMVIRTLDAVTAKKPDLKPIDLYRDKKEDLQFAVDLFRNTISDQKMLSELIDAKTKNWEADRIASTDLLLMEMALAEFMHAPSVPTKVTMNEYIEISKEDSTPRSAVFINGVLDNILIDLKAEGKVKKSGKGLINT